MKRIRVVTLVSALRVERATRGDATSLTVIVNDAYRAESGTRGWTHEVGLFGNAPRTSREALIALMSEPSAVVLKCVDSEGRIVGCVHLEHRAGETYLGLLSVSPSRQGQGVGKMLMEEGERLARRRGSSRVVMTVISRRSELIDWYVRHGYQATGERLPFPVDEIVGPGSEGLDFVVLAKPLPPT